MDRRLAERIVKAHPHERLRNILLFTRDPLGPTHGRSQTTCPDDTEKIGSGEMFEVRRPMKNFAFHNHQRKHKKKTITTQWTSIYA